MRSTRFLIVGVSAAAVAGVLALVASRAVPLGVPGEWEWMRVRFAPSAIDVALAAVGVAAYCGFAAIGLRALRGAPGRGRERLWVASLFAASVAVQAAAQSGGPIGHGSMKVATLAMRGSSGYFGVARTQMDDPWRFWADYPRWIRRQDALHVGTHPPGLFVVSRALLGTMRLSPGLSGLVAACAPASVDMGFRTLIPEPLPRADRSAVAMMALLTLLACSATVIPLYSLARVQLSAEASWMAATLWALAPSAILFQPTADTGFPLLATLALSLVARGGLARAGVAGAILALGMQFTLGFLAVGLVVGIVQVTRPGLFAPCRAGLVVATGAGFLLVTFGLWASSGANPFAIWWWNQTNHARFYVESPRSYLAWLIVNPIELAVAMGLPTAALAIFAFSRGGAPRASWAVLMVLVLLNASGKNASEVARLWLMFFPPLLAAAGSGLARAGAGPRTLALVVGLIGIQTLWLQGLIQVVSPTN